MTLYYVELVDPRDELPESRATSLGMWQRYIVASAFGKDKYNKASTFTTIEWSYRRICVFSSLVLEV